MASTKVETKDLSGLKLGRWSVVSKMTPRGGSGHATRWLCECDCGTVKTVRSHALRSGRSRSCGCTRYDPRFFARGPAHRNWKGGRTINNYGYAIVSVVLPGETLRTRVGEHVFVMSMSIGRKLASGESVHHKNGIRTDNRLENLELWTKRQPSGQRVHDMVAFAKDILREYEPDSLARN